MKRKSPGESVIEKATVKAIIARGGVVDKTVSLSRRGYFDRVAVIGGHTYFIETKRPKGGKVSLHQLALHRDYAAAGATVIVIHNEIELNAWLSTVDARIG
jgi:hypothetical protein